MRLVSRRHASPFLIILLPYLAAALVADSKSKSGTVQLKAGDADDAASIDAAIAISGPPAVKVGTKDAPVDGLDGKPHAGPFVESTRKKSSQKIEDIDSSKPASAKDKETILTETFDLPEDDGVMSDLSNHKEVTGPTGTEGGVTQKDRERKEKGQTEKKPEQPKGPPSRPDDKTKTYTKLKKEGDEDKEKKKGAAGLEVSSITVPIFFDKIH